jgi:flagellum-specific peptidoglycan hydrolase FlgJ
MTDAHTTPLNINVSKLTGYDRIKDTSNRFYSNKIRSNPEFYAKEKERIKEYKKNRYNTDPEYAEKVRIRAREGYYIRKSKLQNAYTTAENIIQEN